MARHFYAVRGTVILAGACPLLVLYRPVPEVSRGQQMFAPTPPPPPHVAEGTPVR